MVPLQRLIAVSVLSTLTMDLCFVLGTKLRLSGPTPGRWAPRWIASLVRGRIRHADIASEPPLRAEVPTFLLAHHLIGFVLALGYFATVGRAGLAGNVAAGVGYGIATSVFAW